MNGFTDFVKRLQELAGGDPRFTLSDLDTRDVSLIVTALGEAQGKTIYKTLRKIDDQLQAQIAAHLKTGAAP